MNSKKETTDKLQDALDAADAAGVTESDDLELNDDVLDAIAGGMGGSTWDTYTRWNGLV